MADFPSMAEVIADIKKGNPDMSDAAARTAAQKVLGDMQGQAQEKFKKRKAEGREDFMCGGQVKKYSKGKMVRGAGCAKKGVRKCKMR